MNVTFDPAKDAANKAKHGVSLADAEAFEWGSAEVLIEILVRLLCPIPYFFARMVTKSSSSFLRITSKRSSDDESNCNDIGLFYRH